MDEGVADEPDDLGGSTPHGGSTEIVVLDDQPTMSFRNVEKAWIYTLDGKFVRFLQHPTTLPADIDSGTYIVKMENNHVIRSRKITVK